ncbi:MAG: porin family protein, partial [Hyphomicrobiales bacterium]|nr:porin family protein [Hyphomicrobiales bacterium]MBV8663768.1 porin family protein [Hyphomicrobiales bacterium]
MTRFQSHSLANAGAIAALFALTVAAQAADLGQKPLPPSPPPLPLAPVSSWSGFYAGAAYGGGHAAAKSSQTGSSTASAWGQSAGAFVGYNFTYGPLVFGPEGDFDFHILRPVNNGGPGLGGSVNDTLETLRLRGRVGYAVGAFMPFVAAGVASAKMYEYSYPWPYLDQGQSHLATGLTLGAGLEYQFAVPYFGPVTVRGEYIYDSYPT